MPAKPIFIARNGHSPKMGTPPALAAAESQSDYCGYFEGIYGDQWLFQYNGLTDVVDVCAETSAGTRFSPCCRSRMCSVTSKVQMSR